MPSPTETATDGRKPGVPTADEIPTGTIETGSIPAGSTATVSTATVSTATVSTATVSTATEAGPTDDDVILLPRWARRIRVIAAVVIFALITVGTVHGGDDDFPFGPLRMYATRDNPNGVVQQGVVQAVTRSGRLLDVTNTSGAPRRAELEGRMSEFAAHPDRFAAVAAVFVPHGNATATDPVIAIRLVRRGFPLHDGRSGPPVDVVVATWTVPQ